MNTDSKNVSNAAKENDDEIDLMALLFAILRGWKTIVFFAVLGLVIGVLYSRLLNPIFESQALIEVEDKKEQGLSALGSGNITDLIAPGGSSIQKEAELINSRMILGPVVDLLHLDIRLTDPAINTTYKIKHNSENTQVSIPEGVALKTADGQAQVSKFNVPREYLNKPFTLVRSNKSNGFVLSNGFDDFKGQLGQAHRFTAREGIIEITVNDLPINEHAINITKQQTFAAIDDLTDTLEVKERGKQTGIMELSLTGTNQQQVTLILKQIIQSYIHNKESREAEETTNTLTFMEKQLPDLKQKLENSEALFNRFREKYGTIDVSQEAGLLVEEKAQIDSQISELKLKKADLTTYYTEEHPLVVQINEQFEILNSRKKEIERKVASLPNIQREFLKLSEDTTINREIYLTMLKSYEQLKIVKAGQVSEVRIVDLPISTYNIIAPNKPLIIGLSILIGAMLGTILVMIKGLIRNVVKDPEHLEARTGVPVVATIPRSPLLTRLRKSKKAPNRLLTYVDNNSLSYEAIKSLRTNLMFGMPAQGRAGQRAKVILITGESPGVGKSFISSNLTEVFAQLDKKVLIMDADMRLGELHRVFNISQDNGLGDYLTQNTTLENNELASFIHPTGIDNIDFMPCGQYSKNPSSLLSTGSFDHLMTELNLHYDYIIIDSPPVLAASDAMILSQYADKVLMVARYDKSIEGQVVYAINQMNKANIKVDGIILNDVQQGLLSKYSYHYSYAYGNNN